MWSHSPSSLDWNVCSVGSGHGHINTYSFGRAAPMLRGRISEESHWWDHVPSLDTEPDQ